MKSLKKILLFCLGVMILMTAFNSCESNEKKEKRQVNRSFRTLEECINSKDSTIFKGMFNSIGNSSLNDPDIDQLFTIFPSGITSYPTPYDDYFTVTDWMESGSYGKNICWSREIINNSTGEHFGISVLERVVDWDTEDLGFIRLIIYPVTELANNQFLRPTTNGRMAFSARLLSMGMFPFSRQRQRYCFSLRQYCTARASFVPPLTGISFSHAKSPSRTGFNRSCRCSCFSVAVRGFFICAPRPSLPSNSRSSRKISLQSSTPLAATLLASKDLSVGRASTNFRRA